MMNNHHSAGDSCLPNPFSEISIKSKAMFVSIACLVTQRKNPQEPPWLRLSLNKTQHFHCDGDSSKSETRQIVYSRIQLKWAKIDKTGVAHEAFPTSAAFKGSLFLILNVLVYTSDTNRLVVLSTRRPSGVELQADWWCQCTQRNELFCVNRQKAKPF